MHVAKEFHDDQGRIYASSFVESQQGLLMDTWGGTIAHPENINTVL